MPQLQDNKESAHLDHTLVAYLKTLTALQRLELNDAAMRAATTLRAAFQRRTDRNDKP